MKPLTREQTFGTLTFYFPYKRGPEQPPEVTVMVRRVSDFEWQAGLSMCSKTDTFDKKVGRKIAFHRLNGFPLRDKSPLGLMRQIAQRIDEVTKRRPYTFSASTIQQLPQVVKRLEDMRVE